MTEQDKEDSLDNLRKRLNHLGDIIDDISDPEESDPEESNSEEEDDDEMLNFGIDSSDPDDKEDNISPVSDSILSKHLLSFGDARKEVEDDIADDDVQEDTAPEDNTSDDNTLDDTAPEDDDFESELPVFLQDEPPNRNKGDYIKWALCHNQTEEYLVKEGFNPNTVRLMALELEKQGYRKRPPKYSKSIQKSQEDEDEMTSNKNLETANNKNKQIQPKKKDKTMQVFSKGAPPEAIIDSIKFPGIFDGREVFFENGMKFGLSVAILGIRMAQELSNLGVSQVKPLIDMTKSMREGEALAAKNAASEAAMEASGLTAQQIGPLMQQVNQKLGQLDSKPSTGNEKDPMKAMMVRTMEPVMKNIMSQMFPGGAAMADMMGSGVAGWTKSNPSQSQENAGQENTGRENTASQGFTKKNQESEEIDNILDNEEDSDSGSEQQLPNSLHQTTDTDEDGSYEDLDDLGHEFD